MKNVTTSQLEKFKKQLQKPRKSKRDVFCVINDPILEWLEKKAQARGLIATDRKGNQVAQVQPVIYELLFAVYEREQRQA